MAATELVPLGINVAWNCLVSQCRIVIDNKRLFNWVEEIAKINHLLRYVCLSVCLPVCPPGTTRLPLDGF